MKTILSLWSFSFLVLVQFESGNPKVYDGDGKHAAKGAIDFRTQILPILQKRCSPCHFPGGKMYERLPFDTSSTILLKKESILKRIKAEDENKLLREFIEQNLKSI
jgi:hypothetical protein